MPSGANLLFVRDTRTAVSVGSVDLREPLCYRRAHINADSTRSSSPRVDTASPQAMMDDRVLYLLLADDRV